MVSITNCTSEITIESIKATMDKAQNIVSDNIPDVLLMTKKAEACLRLAIPSAKTVFDPDGFGFMGIYGIPFESFETLQEMHFRALELQCKGVRLALICE